MIKITEDKYENKTLEELKIEFDYVESSDPHLNALSDAVLQKLLEVQQHKEKKNRLLMLESMPELFVLVKRRGGIKKYGRKMRLKIKTLKVLYSKRNSKKFYEQLEKKLIKRVKKYEKTKNIKDIEGLSGVEE